jgi:glucosamine-6-phosphate deaminase
MDNARSMMIDTLEVLRFETRESMGRAAARDVADLIIATAARKSEVNMIFAAAPSQDELLESLLAIPEIPWNRVVAMHMDEYIGLPAEAPQRFASYLDQHLFNKAPFKEVHRLNSSAAEPLEECRRYARILERHPVDIVCMGVGENGHIAFNDPPVADFQDPELVKIVALERACREQQVHDKCFERLEAVPERAMTLTVPALFGAAHLVCVVPGPLKADAVRRMLSGPVETACPASILRNHRHARLFLDADSASKL